MVLKKQKNMGILQSSDTNPPNPSILEILRTTGSKNPFKSTLMFWTEILYMLTCPTTNLENNFSGFWMNNQLPLFGYLPILAVCLFWLAATFWLSPTFWLFVTFGPSVNVWLSPTFYLFATFWLSANFWLSATFTSKIC